MGDEKHFCESFEDADRKVRKYVFTSFADDPPVLTDAMKYLLYAPETCPSTGKKHWQGFVIYKNRKARNAVRKELKSWANPANGDIESQLAYIKGPYEKDGKTKPINPDAVELGEIDTQGVSADIKLCFADIKAKKRRVSEILEEEPMLYHQYGRTLLDLEDKQDYEHPRTKARLYFIEQSQLHEYTCDNAWWCDSHWACDYEHQSTIFVNAQRTHWTENDLLNLIHGHPFYMDRKHRSRIAITAKTIIFYSPFSIATTWKHIKWAAVGGSNNWGNWADIVTKIQSEQH